MSQNPNRKQVRYIIDNVFSLFNCVFEITYILNCKYAEYGLTVALI